MLGCLKMYVSLKIRMLNSLFVEMKFQHLKDP